jgi:ribosomal protein S18 acetylase RimI-like enzyme
MDGPDPGEVLLVAAEEGVVVGYAIGEPCADDEVYRGQLTQLCVLPSHQRRSVGRLLLREVASRLAAQGIHSLRVGVLRVNPNRLFYERLGGQYLYDRELDWDGVLLPECVYGWRDTRRLLEG